MPDWGAILKGVGEVLEGAGHGLTIRQWLDISQGEALNSIEEFVKRSSTERIDSMDLVLLQMATTQFNVNERLQLVKYYTFFKVAEFNRFEKWRGFPSV